jgi:micrococcal nuclease
VVRTVDGDTIRVRIAGAPDGEEKVRFIGVDTPETHGPGGLRECFGEEASRRTAALLPPGTKVRLVRDVEARDRYQRLLAYVYRADDQLFVNLALAREGFAAPLTIPPNVAHSDAFVEAAAEARRGERGLWGRCGGPDTPLG